MFEILQNKKKKEGGKQAARDAREEGWRERGMGRQHKREENPTTLWPACGEVDMR